MDYYIVQSALAERLGAKDLRQGNPSVGYLVNSGDFAGMDLQAAVSQGARRVSEKEARQFVDKLKSL